MEEREKRERETRERREERDDERERKGSSVFTDSFDVDTVQQSSATALYDIMEGDVLAEGLFYPFLIILALENPLNHNSRNMDFVRV